MNKLELRELNMEPNELGLIVNDKGVLTGFNENFSKYKGVLIIPKGVIGVEDWVLYCRMDIKEMVISDTVRRFGQGALLGCTELEKITMCDGLNVGERILFNGEKLNEVNIIFANGNVQKLGLEDGLMNGIEMIYKKSEGTYIAKMRENGCVEITKDHKINLEDPSIEKNLMKYIKPSIRGTILRRDKNSNCKTFDYSNVEGKVVLG